MPVTRATAVLSDTTRRNVGRAAQLLAQADALLITTGAGMGVDSGLPDFRGDAGLWKAYPALGELRLSFKRLAQPAWFAQRPEIAWGFYGHRQSIYRDATPHMGFAMLRDWARAMPAGHFVVTSNVDGQFGKAGFEVERTLEQHGNLHWLQCTAPCGPHLWPFAEEPLEVDLAACAARGPLPTCPDCGAMARPNVLLFDDLAFVPTRRREQQARYQSWLASVRRRRLVILEIGAGVAVPTIRRLGEQLAVECERATLVRINPQARIAEEPCLPIALGALDALTLIETQLPEAFRLSAREGRPGPRRGIDFTSPAAQRAPAPLPPRELQLLDFPGIEQRPEPASWSTDPRGRLDYRAVTFVDLDTGLARPMSWAGITAADERACLDCWFGPQKGSYAPVPEALGYVDAGYLTTGRTFRLEPPGGRERPGAAIMQICDPERRPLITLAVARRVLHGARAWRELHEGANVPSKALEYPRVPWVVQRVEPLAAEHGAMLPALLEVGRVLAWTWFRVVEDGDRREQEDS